MRIFFVCHRVPFPPNRGDKIATYNKIRHLARQHEVHVLCLADGADDLTNVAGLRGEVASVTAVAVSPLRSRLRALRALPGGAPLSVAMLAEPALHAAIRRRFTDLAPDLIFVYSSNVAQFAEPFPRTRRIMHFSDLDSLKWRAYAQRAVLPMRWLYALEGRRLLEYERHVARTFSRSLVCTEAEAEDFRALIPDAPVDVVRNGVDVAYFRPAGAVRQPASLVFTGVMNYRPNVDAVRWFCSAILPLVRRDVPAATLTICGSRPNGAVRRLGRLAGVTVTGAVADVRPYLDRAEVFVAPLRIARGIQNKVLEAMAMGLPVVTTQAVWRASAIPAGDGIVAADTAEAFAAQVVRLLRDPSHRAAMAHRARLAVESGHSWDAQLTALDRVIAAVAAAPQCDPSKDQYRRGGPA